MANNGGPIFEKRIPKAEMRAELNRLLAENPDIPIRRLPTGKRSPAAASFARWRRINQHANKL